MSRLWLLCVLVGAGLAPSSSGRAGPGPVPSALGARLSSLVSFSVGGEPSATVLRRAAVVRAGTGWLDAWRNQTTAVLSDAKTGLTIGIELTQYNLSRDDPLPWRPDQDAPAADAATPSPPSRDTTAGPGSEYALEWVLNFSAAAAGPTLCHLRGVDLTVQSVGASGQQSPRSGFPVHRFLGSFASPNDYSMVNETLTEGPSAVQNETRLWGDVALHNASVGAVDACVALCNHTVACVGMVFSVDPQFQGCYLLTSITRSTTQPSFWSWTASADVSFAPISGRPSDGTLPYWSVAGAEWGRVFSLGWSGNWQARLSAPGNGTYRVEVEHPTLCTAIEPGVVVRSMRVLMVHYRADTGQAYHRGFNLHRRLLSRYKVPQAPASGGPRPAGALVSSWSWLEWPHYPDMRLQMQLWHCRAAKATGVEAYWLDAGWFNGGFPNGVGNWQLPLSSTVAQGEFPNGTLAPLGNESHSSPNPVSFIVWFEPERVHTGTYIATKHPSFVLQSGAGGNGLLDLGNPDAWEYIRAFLSTAVEEWGLDVLRIDYNLDPAPCWLAHDAPGRKGLTENLYVQGLYRLWDSIAAAHPGLLIDTCASGGRRIDLETLSRAVPLWRSDHAKDAATANSQTMGISYFAPVSSGAVFALDPYSWRATGVVGKVISWGEAGWKAVMANATSQAQLRLAIAETQRIRDVALDPAAAYYALSPVAYSASGAWSAYQFSVGAARGFVFAFRQPGNEEAARVWPLVDVDLAATYNMTVSVGFEATGSAEVGGAELASLEVSIPAGSSVLVEYWQTSA